MNFPFGQYTNLEDNKPNEDIDILSKINDKSVSVLRYNFDDIEDVERVDKGHSCIIIY